MIAQGLKDTHLRKPFYPTGTELPQGTTERPWKWVVASTDHTK